MMRRRFVNLVSHKWFGRADSSIASIYSLHRIDVAGKLFYPSTADAKKAAKAEEAANGGGGAVSSWPQAIQRMRDLPEATMTFQAESWRALQADTKVLFFALLNPRDSEGRILFSNRLGHSVLYDADTNCVTAMPTLAGKVGCHPITISLSLPGELLQPEEEDLYVMHNAASRDWGTTCFGALRFGEAMDHHVRKAWLWDPLPAPPLGRRTAICSHAVVVDGNGQAAICVSARSYAPSTSTCTDGTYCFDTVKREWKCVGDWILPFEGGAVHVPGDGDLWLGFTGNGRDLCAASGLSASMEETAPAPACVHAWRDAGKVPGNWRTTCPKLLDLGGGRFCITKKCFIMPDTEEYDEDAGRGIEVALLSGVELLLTGRPPGSIDIVEHKSLGYICRNDSIRWVL